MVLISSKHRIPIVPLNFVYSVSYIFIMIVTNIFQCP